jgi:hypothetical protein
MGALAVASSLFAVACVAGTGEPVGEAEQGVGEFCGGIAGFQCPSGLVCVDDPHDGCDPNQGGADCGGICVKPKGRKGCGGPDRHYASKNLDQCAAILFKCSAGQEAFFDHCGCGCEDVACDYSDPSRTWVAQDPATCMLVKYTCASGVGFSDGCGCGCVL